MSAADPAPIVPPPGQRFDLAAVDTRRGGAAAAIDRAAAAEAVVALRARIDEFQELLYADRRFAVLVVLQAIDTGGKDGTIRSVFVDTHPLGVHSHSFGVPREEERAHHFLWRYSQKLPRKGELTIFNRSHYESVLVERVKALVPESVWRPRYRQINNWEAMLAAEGTVIVKFFLHISKEEQRQRLQERVDNPKKRWKFRAGDLEERKRWDDYQAAFADMLGETSTTIAPWHVVPADRNWYRDYLVASTVAARLESLNLRYPAAEAGIEGLVVE